VTLLAPNRAVAYGCRGGPLQSRTCPVMEQRRSMTLQLRTRSFKVVEATIDAALLRPYWRRYDATVTDTLAWTLSVTCAERRFDGESWQPEFTFDRFPLPIERWSDLEFLTVSLESGTAHVVGHGAVGRTEARFGKRTGPRFELACRGECDVDWDDKFGPGVPYTLDTRVEFEGIRVVGTSDDDDDSLRRFLQAHFRLDGLREEPCAESGSLRRSRERMIAKLFLPLQAE
jgi:hypothetical protein